MSASTARAFPRHTHDEYGIGVVDAGGHASWSGRGQVEAGPGYFISVNPGEVHDGRAIGGRPRAWRILYFDPVALADVRADIMDGAPRSFTFTAPVSQIAACTSCSKLRFGTPARADRTRHDALRDGDSALGRAAREHSTARPRRDEGPTACIRRARQRIDTDPAAPVTLIELAKESGLSRYQLIRAFARELGLTPHAYILQRRIALAQRLIRTGCDLAEVAVRQASATRAISRAGSCGSSA